MNTLAKLHATKVTNNSWTSCRVSKWLQVNAA